MKKIVVMLLVMSAMLSMTACGDDWKQSFDQGMKDGLNGTAREAGEAGTRETEEPETREKEGPGTRETGEPGTQETAAGNREVSEQNAAGADARQEPPDIMLYPAAGEGDSLTLRACGYNWNWPEGADQMGAAIADSAHPLSEGASWDILTLPEGGDGFSDYGLTVEAIPDETGIHMWNLEEIGNSGAPGSQIAVYHREEMAAEEFSIPLQAGKVYEMYMKWEEEDIGENGGFGIAYYVFKTARPASEETESVEGISMTVTQATPEGACLEILNRTDKELTMGDDYELQVWKDEDWHQVDYIIDNAAFHAVGYMVRKDEPLRMDVNWTYFHGILPAGRYRITKTADVEEADGSVIYRLSAEFTLE